MIFYIFDKNVNHLKQNNLITFGERVRELRVAKGLSLKQLAERLGIDYTTLSKIENGERYPLISSVRPYSDALGSDYRELQIIFLKEKIAKQINGKDFAVEAMKEAISESKKR